MKLRVGDNVLVTTGKDKGKKGLVSKVFPAKARVLIEGVNQVVKHKKPVSGKSGERVVLSRPIDVSKVVILNGNNEPDRVGMKVLKDGTKLRIFRKTGEMIENKNTKIVSKEKKK